MKVWFCLVIFAGLWALICASGAAQARETASEARVARDGDVWTVDYALAEDAPVWAFIHSGLQRESREPWRPLQWRVRTEGVVLDRVGARDVLRSEDGGPVPRRVSIVFSPAPLAMEASYEPALIFTDGSAALHSDQFDIFPLDSLQAAGDLPADLNAARLRGGFTRTCWTDRAGPVLLRGERAEAPCEIEARTYVLFGAAGLAETDHLAMALDPELPGWIGEEISGFAPEITAWYEDRLGPGLEARPTIMASWKGPTERVTSMGGSVLRGLIVMSFEGEGVLEASQTTRHFVRWFLGHETAHFWLGHVVRYEFAQDMWITEGGADLMAVRALEALDPAYDGRDMLQDAVDDCAALSEGRGIVRAGERGEHRAYYACGAVFAMVAEAAARRAGGVDWFDFLAPLIAANREAGVLTATAWLEALTGVSGDPALAERIAVLLHEGSDAPHDAIAALFEAAGVAHEIVDDEVRLA